MISTCILLGIWTSGLLFMTVRAEKKRLLLGGEGSAPDKESVVQAGEGPADEV